MNLTLSRRTLLAFAGVGVLSAGSVRSAVARAQAGTTSPFTFPNGVELSWAAPWVMNDENYASAILPNSAPLQGGQEGELLIGFYDAPTSIDDATKAILTFIVQDPALAPNVAGGEDKKVGGGGVVESQTAYRVHGMTLNGVAWGAYIQLVSELDLTVFIAPVAVFASELATAQGSVTVGGTAVLADVDGAKIQQQLEGAAAKAGGTTSEASAIPADEGGEYTDDSGFVHVTWIAGWTIVSQNEVGIELANPAESIIVSMQGVPFDGRTWQQAADDEIAHLAGDQGPNATVSGPTVTDSGFSFASEGDYGLRLVQATPSESPDLFVLVFASHIEVNGADALALLEEAQAAIQVNGNAPLKGLDTFIDMSAS